LTHFKLLNSNGRYILGNKIDMETHTFWNEIFKWQIYIGNKIDMGTPKFVNPKPQVEIWHILNYQTQVVDRFLETK
jgi:hypothetical protein